MVTVERGNVVLTIKESEIDRYIDLGYNLVGEHGEVIREAVPTDLGALRKAFIEHTKTIKALEQEIATLKTKSKLTRKTQTSKEEN